MKTYSDNNRMTLFVEDKVFDHKTLLQYNHIRLWTHASTRTFPPEILCTEF